MYIPSEGPTNPPNYLAPSKQLNSFGSYGSRFSQGVRPGDRYRKFSSVLTSYNVPSDGPTNPQNRYTPSKHRYSYDPYGSQISQGNRYSNSNRTAERFFGTIPTSKNVLSDPSRIQYQPSGAGDLSELQEFSPSRDMALDRPYKSDSQPSVSHPTTQHQFPLVKQELSPFPNMYYPSPIQENNFLAGGYEQVTDGIDHDMHDYSIPSSWPTEKGSQGFSFTELLGSPSLDRVIEFYGSRVSEDIRMDVAKSIDPEERVDISSGILSSALYEPYLFDKQTDGISYSGRPPADTYFAESMELDKGNTNRPDSGLISCQLSNDHRQTPISHSNSLDTGLPRRLLLPLAYQSSQAVLETTEETPIIIRQQLRDGKAELEEWREGDRQSSVVTFVRKLSTILPHAIGTNGSNMEAYDTLAMVPAAH
ncbi:hypothetical protein BJ508DRAFT_329887 [Ascobolus immersus RN42]|uniref:Uncharacterized protein n=1 Tax=Ascobolus immersus RN42 TaxID=1160509 RepID=A0A3N4I0L0_ASCIM|nr:hypothetical protein BJ508DRAFT_329887 [Ascobolus immersus RN42]